MNSRSRDFKSRAYSDSAISANDYYLIGTKLKNNSFFRGKNYKTMRKDNYIVKTD